MKLGEEVLSNLLLYLGAWVPEAHLRVKVIFVLSLLLLLLLCFDVMVTPEKCELIYSKAVYCVSAIVTQLIFSALP